MVAQKFVQFLSNKNLHWTSNLKINKKYVGIKNYKTIFKEIILFFCGATKVIHVFNEESTINHTLYKAEFNNIVICEDNFFLWDNEKKNKNELHYVILHLCV